MQGAHMADDLIGTDQKIPDWLIKITVLLKIDLIGMKIAKPQSSWKVPTGTKQWSQY